MLHLPDRLSGCELYMTAVEPEHAFARCQLRGSLTHI
jgi:hypothetical protein